MECPDLMRMLLHHATSNPLSLMLGVWLGADATANQKQIELLGKLLDEYPNANVIGISVGNEVLHRHEVAQATLIKYIQQVIFTQTP